MHRLTFFFVLAIAMLFQPPANASKEGMLAFSDFSVKSPGLGNSGPVEISGTQISGGITSIRISAFKRETSLNTAQLAQIRGLIANGIQISFELGYKETGGKKIYIVLTEGLTSGRARAVTIQFTEAGKLRITQESS